MVRLYCPDTLDLVSLLAERGHVEWVNSAPKLYYVMTVIYRARWNKTNHEGDFVPVHAKTLRKVLGTRFARHATNLLIELGIIETDGHYKVGRKSRGYRFTDPYRNVRFYQVAEVANWQLPDSLRADVQARHSGEAGQFLYETMQRVTLDMKVKDFLKQLPLESMTQQDYYERAVENIQLKEWFFATDQRSGRVFNNITGLPKKLRPFLRLDGKPLVETDVANCQPFLLLGLYGNEPEREQFQEWVKDGQFYEKFAAAVGFECSPVNRGEFKDSVLVFLFDRVRRTPHKYAEIFAKQFPVLYSRIVMAKQGDYRNLARRLQADEASIVINTFVRRVAQTSRMPVLTIHDSVLSLEEHVSEVRELLGEKFRERFGVAPLLRVKRQPTENTAQALAA